MKKVQIFIYSFIAVLLFSGCNQKAVIQHENSLAVQSPVLTGNQDDEILALRQRVNELETELERRVGHLENYFDRRTPESVASLYGEAVKTRNGALQYALFSKELKDKTYDDFISMDWHTGVSSPHVSDYSISKPIREEEGEATINVVLRYKASDGDPLDETCTLYLEQTQKEINDDWYITSIKDTP